MDSALRITRQIEAHERVRAADREQLWQLTLEERTRLIKLARDECDFDSNPKRKM